MVLYNNVHTEVSKNKNLKLTVITIIIALKSLYLGILNDQNSTYITVPAWAKEQDNK